LSDCFTNYFVMSQQVGTRFAVRRRATPVACCCSNCRPTARRTKKSAPTAGSTVALASTLKPKSGPGQRNRAASPVPRRAGAPVRCPALRFLQLFARTFRQCPGQSGLEDAQALVDECGGEVEIDCQFCNERYLFDASDVLNCLLVAASTTPSDTRH
jgi:molecular chaperone Hsp33